MKVFDVMSSDVICVDADETAAAAARLLSRRNVGILPVCKSGTLVGVLTDRDLVLRCLAAGLPADSTLVRQVMTRRVITVSPDDSVRLAAGKMATEQIRRLPVVACNAPVGIVSLSDLARQPDYSLEAAECLCDVCDNTSPRP